MSGRPDFPPDRVIAECKRPPRPQRPTTYRSDGIAFVFAEVGLAMNAIVWPLSGHSLWTSLAWIGAMFVTWRFQRWLNS